MQNEEPRRVQMNVTSTNEEQGEFTFDMHARAHAARTVRFAIDQTDAKALYEALGKFLRK